MTGSLMSFKFSLVAFGTGVIERELLINRPSPGSDRRMLCRNATFRGCRLIESCGELPQHKQSGGYRTGRQQQYGWWSRHDIHGEVFSRLKASISRTVQAAETCCPQH
jgi:hypothetical protein